jgi:hypothetical protein
MAILPGRGALLLWASVIMAGCHAVQKTAKQPLSPPVMPPDSCVLEVFFVRFPFGDPEVNLRLWEEVDELHFPAPLRQRLGGNGLRVGLVGGQIPVALSKLLELEGKAAPSGDANQVNVVDLDREPPVMRRRLSVRAGHRKEIVTSDIYQRLPVLIWEPGRLYGETYCKAQTILGLRTFPEGDGRVRVDLVPEVHYDEPRQRWVGDQGMLRLEAGRPRRGFDEMAVSATLAPGSMLVISGLPNRPGSLGHYFFSQDRGQAEQKLLVLRLSQTQHDGLFCPPEVLPLGP